MPSTVTIQSVVNYATTHVELMPLVGVAGYSNEPALSLANDVMAEILSSPFAWKFNRKTLNVFVAAQNKQDFKFGGACAFTLAGANVVGGVGIKLKSATGITSTGFPGTVTVNTLDPHNFAVGDTVYMTGNVDAAYNSAESITPSLSSWSGGFVVTAVPTTTSFQFAAISGQTITSGASGITDFGWAEYATMVNENEGSSPRKIQFLTAARELQPSSFVNIPSKITAVDNQDGTLTLRLWQLPGAAPWGISIVYQAKAAPFTSLNSVWSPIPDEFLFMIRQMFLAKAYDYIGSGKATVEDQKAQRAIMKALQRDDVEESEEFIVPAEPLMRDIF